jgi:hypothetical protein
MLEIFWIVIDLMILWPFEISPKFVVVRPLSEITISSGFTEGQ